MVGYFGNIKFETSDKKILTFSELKHDSAGRWEKHSVIGQKPISEFIGPDLDTITFTINLNGNNGIKPRDEMNKWISMVNSGIADILVIGNKALRKDKWAVKSVSEAWNTVFNRGELYSGSINVTLEEYIEVIQKEPKTVVPSYVAVKVTTVKSKLKYGVVTASVLNVRKGPGTNYLVINQLKKGTKVVLAKLTGNWYNINLGNRSGYVSAQYIK